MLRKIFKWLDNFWYHYKWVTLVTAFFTVTLSIIIIQMITKTNPDSNILYGGPAVLTANQTKEIENAFNALLPEDFNGDGEKITSLQAITLMTKEQIAKAEAEAAENSSVFVYNPQSLENNKTSFSTQLFSGEYVICLIDPEQYKNAYKAGGFAPLSELFGENNIPEYAYDDCALLLSETNFSKFFTAMSVFPDDTLICVRKMSSVSAIKGKSKAEREYNNQLRLFYSIIALTPPEGFSSNEYETESA
jgi:hypothetical protein